MPWLSPSQLRGLKPNLTPSLQPSSHLNRFHQRGLINLRRPPLGGPRLRKGRCFEVLPVPLERGPRYSSHTVSSRRKLPADLVVPPSPAADQHVSVQTPLPATGQKAGRTLVPGSDASKVSTRTVIPLSSGAVQDMGAQPVVVSAMQLGDSSRFDPQSHNDQSKAVEEACYWCQQDHHLRDCPGLLSLESIKSYRENIEASEEATDAKVS